MWTWLHIELANDAWSRALAVLVDVGVKGIVLLALAGLVALAMRRASAAARHLVWTLALTGLLLLPVLSFVMPKWQLPILPIAATPAEQMVPAPTVEPQRDEIAVAEAEYPITAVAPTPLSTPAPVVSSPAPAPMTVPLSPTPDTSYPVAYWVLLAWLAATLVVLTPLVAGFAVVGRLRRKAVPFSNDALPTLAHSLAESLGLRRPVTLLCAGHGAMPMAAGLLRPVVFLPQEAEDWPHEKLQAVLLHELAHVKRRDCLTHALARVTAALHWFNPLVWMALRRLRIERERACDDLVLTAGERPSAYADHLLEIARTMHAGALASAAAITMARKSQIEGRLLAVLDPRRNRKAIKRWAAALGILALLAVIMPLGMAELSAREPDANKAQVYEIVFDNGVRAFVLGVGEPGDGPNRAAWTPEGTLLPYVPSGHEDVGCSAHPSQNEVAREFYVRFELPAEDEEAGVKLRVKGRGGSCSLSRRSNTVHADLAAAFPAEQREAVLELGVTAGPWETLAEGAPGSGHSTSDLSVAFGETYLKDGRTHVVVTHGDLALANRVLAFDASGKAYSATGTSSTGGGGFTQLTLSFADSISPDDVERLEFQVRDDEWKEISSIALHPSGEKSDSIAEGEVRAGSESISRPDIEPFLSIDPAKDAKDAIEFGQVGFALLWEYSEYLNALKHPFSDDPGYPTGQRARTWEELEQLKHTDYYRERKVFADFLEGQLLPRCAVFINEVKPDHISRRAAGNTNREAKAAEDLCMAADHLVGLLRKCYEVSQDVRLYISPPPELSARATDHIMESALNQRDRALLRYSKVLGRMLGPGYVTAEEEWNKIRRERSLPHLRMIQEIRMRNHPKGPNALREDLVWGDMHNGLQAAVRFLPVKDRYELGETISREFFIRNAGNQDVEFLTSARRQYDQATVWDESGKTLNTSGADLLITLLPRRVLLKPGCIVILQSAGFAFMPADAPETPDYPVGTWVKTRAGTHTVQFEVRFPDATMGSGEGAPKPGDWTGTLTTGEKKVEVVEPAIESLPLTIRFLEEESTPSPDGPKPDSEYCWRIESSAPLQVADRTFHLREDGVMKGNWGGGPGNEDNHGGYVDLVVRPRVDGSVLLMETEHRTANGKSVGSMRVPIPEGADLEERWRTEPFETDGMNYVALWEGQFVRDGKTVKSLVFAGAAARMDDAGFSGRLDLHKPHDNLPLIGLQLGLDSEKDDGIRDEVTVPAPSAQDEPKDMTCTLSLPKNAFQVGDKFNATAVFRNHTEETRTICGHIVQEARLRFEDETGRLLTGAGITFIGPINVSTLYHKVDPGESYTVELEARFSTYTDRDGRSDGTVQLMAPGWRHALEKPGRYGVSYHYTYRPVDTYEPEYPVWEEEIESNKIEFSISDMTVAGADEWLSRLAGSGGFADKMEAVEVLCAVRPVRSVADILSALDKGIENLNPDEQTELLERMSRVYLIEEEKEDLAKFLVDLLDKTSASPNAKLFVCMWFAERGDDAFVPWLDSYIPKIEPKEFFHNDALRPLLELGKRLPPESKKTVTVPLLKIMTDAPEHIPRSRAEQHLASIADDFIIPELVKTLKDPRYRARVSAAHVLGAYAGPDVLPALEAMRDETNDEYLVKNAKRALKAIEERQDELEAEPATNRAARSEVHPEAKQYAADSVAPLVQNAEEAANTAQLVDEWAARLDSETPEQWLKANRELAEMGRPALPTLGAIIEQNRSPLACKNAVHVLGAMASEVPEALDLLAEVAQDNTWSQLPDWPWVDASMQSIAIGELGRMTWAAEQLIPTFRSIIDDGQNAERIRTLAVSQLGKMGKEAKRPLRKYAESDNRKIQEAAERARTRLRTAQKTGKDEEYYVKLIRQNPLDPQVRHHLRARKGEHNRDCIDPLAEEVKLTLRDRLRTEPDATAALTLARIIQDQLMLTDLMLVAPVDRGTLRRPRENPAENYGTMAEVLELGYQHAQDDGLRRELGIGLAKLRLLEGNWDRMNTMLESLGQKPIPAEERPWLHAPPTDWSPGLAERWTRCDESMRSGSCNLAFRVEKDGSALVGAHVLLKQWDQQREERRQASTGIRADTILFMPVPLVLFEPIGSFGYGEDRGRALTRYGVTGALGEVRFDNLPVIPVKIEVLVPTSNFHELDNDWGLWVESAPGEFKRIYRHYDPETSRFYRSDAAPEVVLEEGQTVHYPLLTIRPGAKE